MSGVLTWEADEPLIDVGRGIYHGIEPDPDQLSSKVWTVLYRRLFAVFASPWRCAFVNLLIDLDGQGPFGAEADEQDAHSRDYLDIRGMLDPSQLSDVVDLAQGAKIRVPGRPIEEVPFLLPGLVVLGSDFYEVEFHPDLGIITSWTGVIRGIVASRVTVKPTWWE